MNNYLVLFRHEEFDNIEGRGLELTSDSVQVYGNGGETLAVFPLNAIYGIYLNPNPVD